MSLKDIHQLIADCLVFPSFEPDPAIIAEEFADPLFSKGGMFWSGMSSHYSEGEFKEGFGMESDAFSDIIKKLNSLCKRALDLSNDTGDVMAEFNEIVEQQDAKRREKYPLIVKTLEEFQESNFDKTIGLKLAQLAELYREEQQMIKQ